MKINIPSKLLKSIILGCAFSLAASAQAADPTATDNTYAQCCGSLMPYPTAVAQVATPDTLTPVYLSHVGRHGSRYPASATHCKQLKAALMRADSLGTLTALGQRLLKLTDQVMARSAGRWGALDSLGMAEQRALATRMAHNYPQLFGDGQTVNALSSYSPRVMMSMFSFTHQLDRMNNHNEFVTSTGRMNSQLVRPFDVDQDYLDFREKKTWEPPYAEYLANVCPLTALTRVVGRDYPFGDSDAARELALAEYYVVAGLQAMEMPSQMETYFTRAEANALWSCFNLRQYLQRTMTTVSSVPADIASALVMNIVNRADAAIEGTNAATVDLRFGHAETLMPLLSLLRLGGCYYMTNYFDTVGLHWRDWAVVPMAANVQFIFFKAQRSGKWYVRVDLNEKPVPLIPNDNRLYLPWGEARAYLLRCVPLYVV